MQLVDFLVPNSHLQGITFLSRGKTLEALRKNGLQFESLGKNFSIKNAKFTDDAEELKTCRYIFFTVKSYDTLTAIDQIKHHVAEDVSIITTQNAINNDLLLADAFGKKRVIPGLATISVSTPSSVYVKHTGLGILVIGEYDGVISSRLTTIAHICTHAAIETIVSDNIQVERWKKYTWNCTFNIIAAITRLRPDQILADPYLHTLSEETKREILMLTKKEDINFGENDPVAERIKFAEKLGTFKPSTLEDLEKGKRIELDAFTGYLLKLARKHSVDIPINQTLYALLRGITHKR